MDDTSSTNPARSNSRGWRPPGLALKLFVTAALAAVMITGSLAVNSTSARADGADAYLGWWESAQGPCSGSYWSATGDVGVIPEHHNSGFFYKKTTYAGAPYYKTDHYIKNAVTKARRFYVCENSRPKGYFFSPLEYVHKWRYTEFNCHSGTCVPLSTWETDGWRPGTQF